MTAAKLQIYSVPADFCSSEATRKRAIQANATSVDSVNAVVEQSDCVFSIVPPRDAAATAEIVNYSFNEVRCSRKKGPLYYADFNAISPSTTSRIANLFDSLNVKYMDGGVSRSYPRTIPALH